VEQGTRLTTIEVTFPRIVLAEFNTHRVFSRNSASSRAIPVEKRIAAVEADPFVPEVFGKNQKGMQASENLSEEDADMARQEWMLACKDAVYRARQLAARGVHKQLANRLIEPFCWHTVIVTATEWENFFALRCHPDAQPEIRVAAEWMQAVYDQSVPQELDEDMWHLPLLPDAPQLLSEGYSMADLCRISVGRCARVSYLTHDGRRDPSADLDLAAKLQYSGHMSPFEHVARPMNRSECEYKYGTHGEFVGDNMTPQKNFCGNFKGWIQLRKELPHEDNFREAMLARD
jgi:hypothetical protein